MKALEGAEDIQLGGIDDRGLPQIEEARHAGRS